MKAFKKAKKLLNIIIGITVLVIIAISVMSNYAHAKQLHPEKYYQDKWCAGKGRVEIVMPDRTRCDCLTSDHAIEFDFGKKWAEAVGQSLHYSMQTGKRAGIVLIIETEKDRKYWIRLNSLIMHFGLPIDTWAIGNGK